MEALNPSYSNSSNPKRVMQSSDKNNHLRKTDADMQKVVSQKCKTHPGKNADLLHLKSNVQNPRICIDCIQQNGIQIKDYIQIQDVLLGSSNSDLLTYPILNDPQLRKEIQPNQNILDTDNSRIDYFYQELLKQIQQKIEARRQTKSLKIIQLGEIYQNSMNCWSQILDIDNLKAILYEENSDSKLASFINAHIANSDSNTRKLREMCDQFKVIQSQFSMEKPYQIKNLISSLLDEINFFDNNNPSPLLPVGQSGQSRNELQLKQQEIDQLVQQLRDCRSQMQEQQRSNQEYRILAQNQISQLTQQLKEEEEKSSRSNNQFELERKPNQSFNYRQQQQQQPVQKEVQALDSTNLLPTTKLLLSSYRDSKKLFIRKNDQQELEYFNNHARDYFDGRSYLDFILDPEVNYVVNVKLEQRKGYNKKFLFGLICDRKKDDSVFNDGEVLFYCEYNGWSHIKTQIKGQPIKTNDDSLEKRNLEMRINIQRRILRVGSLPNYDSVVQIDKPEWIKPDIPYRFFLEGLNSKTKITITKLETVSQFDNLI